MSTPYEGPAPLGPHYPPLPEREDETEETECPVCGLVLLWPRDGCVGCADDRI